MTVGELFREICRERYGVLDEERARLADQVNPNLINWDIPEDMIPKLKQKLLDDFDQIEREILEGKNPATGVYRQWIKRN